MEEKKLEQCPFCEDVSGEIIENDDNLYQVKCKTCGARGPEASTGRYATILWNREF
jgi:translation initiation factor 2 beta subunit (eIF-2beta)/eIF-5